MNDSVVMLKRQKPYVVKGASDILSGREEGKGLAEKALKHLESLEPNSVVPLDFSKARFMDFSCADEFLTKVLRRITSGELGTRYIVLQGMSPTLEENVVAALTLRDIACPKITKDGSVELIGKISTELIDTYKLAARKGRITARDVVAIAPRVGISAISNRLTKLQKMGLLLRTKEFGGEAGGRQFVYESVS